ncbi:peptide/nickel transport system permease protein [Aliiroseovarius halocynthiae]|uniref:ABC transporter permease n=1 Tax=Aliiroseovarius halocynthiae TaxID=985055 RepID=A0A545SV70_9RHOB|nr:ABC transporter permease [Aliiroseovarius halocynthiae]TQV68848.1 ABC transporter permease [Aliiroseovarius halocynthiae]SMR71280.1 peptide/nickel transport system permease protein [Aliiroseovarius halocynthiae]
MLTYCLRRLAFSVPVLVLISFAIFLLMDLAPNDPTSNLPMSIPADTRAQLREALGIGDPLLTRYLLWCKQFFIHEPLNWLTNVTGLALGDPDRLRVLSWSARVPVVDLIAERLPQTLWVVGMSYLLGIAIALPIGIYSAYRQHGWFDHLGSFISMIGYSVPSFFLGVVMIIVFAVKLNWLPSVYDTTLRVTDWGSLMEQFRQMVMPVAILALYNAAQISRYMRASMLDNLHHDYVRTARAKGASERRVMLRHVARNSMLPVVTVIALGIPQVLAGAVITEQIFKINGIGELLISAIQSGDLPVVQTLTFLFAVLVVLFNLFADIAYGLLDPRISYD